MRLIKEKIITDENAKVDMFSNLFASCFYIGYFPKASGTFGSLFGVLFFLFEDFKRPEILLPSIIICFIAGIYTSKVMMKRFGDDPSVVVIDEVVGMWITVMVYLFFSKGEYGIYTLILLFFFFRFFDIVKIQPAKYYDNSKTAFGVMMDDVIAGIYAGLSAFALVYIASVIITHT
ncbi:MAG: phosphatidylglycerophosphatase A [Ignavibacteria bacterium]|nr:phosphatidylglycerophosphatase A [Ignavibacteria bacterium]